MTEVAAAIMCIGVGALIGLTITSRFSLSQALVLDRATHVKSLIGLKEFVDKRPLNSTVVVYGTVGSTSSLKPKHIDSKKNIPAVYVHESAILRYKRMLTEVVSVPEIDSTSLSCEEVPWYLDDGTAQVKVLNYQRAYGFDDLLQVYRSYAPVPKLYEELASNKEIVFTADKRRCERWEQVLYVGTKLTIVGRAGIDEDGTPTIDEAYQFYSERIEPKAKVSDLEEHSKFCETLAVVLTVMGIIILAKTFLQNSDSSSKFSITA